MPKPTTVKPMKGGSGAAVASHTSPHDKTMKVGFQE
jgi:hypothetical protein